VLQDKTVLVCGNACPTLILVPSPSLFCYSVAVLSLRAHFCRMAPARAQDAIRLLVLEYGANAGLADTHAGESPLHVACRFGMDSTARLLGECGASTGLRRASDGFTPLHEAARWGNVGCAKVLLSLATEAARGKGADAGGSGGAAGAVGQPHGRGQPSRERTSASRGRGPSASPPRGPPRGEAKEQRRGPSPGSAAKRGGSRGRGGSLERGRSLERGEPKSGAAGGAIGALVAGAAVAGPAAAVRAAGVALVNAEALVAGKRGGLVTGRGVTPVKVAATYGHLQVGPQSTYTRRKARPRRQSPWWAYRRRVLLIVLPSVGGRGGL